MKSLERRIRLLESNASSQQPDTGLRAEISVMPPDERNILREFLEYHRDGGLPGDSEYEILKTTAEKAIASARKRLTADQNIAA
jgi:hypothetical protein